jgi:hypothetical protein
MERNEQGRELMSTNRHEKNLFDIPAPGGVPGN